MAKAKTIAKGKNDKLAKRPDAALIEACIDYATALRGSSGAFEADLTGDNDFAAAREGAALRRADRAYSLIVESLPSTLDGLMAKATAAKVGLDNDRHTGLLLQSVGDVQTRRS